MTDRIQEITEKIYNEGIVKAKEDAGQIIFEAKAEAEKIIGDAQKKHEHMIAKAQKLSEEIKKRTESELQLAARQFTSKLKQQITEMITTAQVNIELADAFSDGTFIKEAILTLMKNWNPQSSEPLNLNVLLPEKSVKEINTFFDAKVTNTLNSGVEIKFDPNFDSGFKIGPKDGSYVLSFTDKDFEHFFKGYLRDRTKKLLFDPVDNE